MMTLQETLNASDILRRYTGCFERCIKAGKDLEARTYLPNIRKACELLDLNWRELIGNENERFFSNTEPFNNRSVSVQYKDESNNKTTIKIVGIDEADLNVGKISYTSPVAKALLKSQVGDTVTVRIPKGSLRLTILKISY